MKKTSKNNMYYCNDSDNVSLLFTINNFVAWEHEICFLPVYFGLNISFVFGCFFKSSDIKLNNK